MQIPVLIEPIAAERLHAPAVRSHSPFAPKGPPTKRPWQT